MKRLVVIDDEYIVVDGIRAMISRLGMDYEVVGSAYDGISALEVIKETSPDMVVTDIRIPGMDGLSLIECAKELLPHTVFVVISGFQEFEYARRALSLGVKGYIDKPITMDKLRSILECAEQKEPQTDPALEASQLSELFIRQIRSGETVPIKDTMERILKLFKEQGLSIEVYRDEAYKILCMGLSVFYEERQERHEREKHLPSYKNLELLQNTDEVDSYCMTILSEMLDKMEAGKSGSSHRTILQLLEYIHQNYYQDIGLNELADMVRMNPAYLSILFKEEVGMSYIKYLTRLRIERAKELLEEGYKVAEVSDMVGYSNYRYFCDIFKKNAGQTPSEYKGRVRKPLP